MKVLLVFPPWGDPTQPYSSLPCLYSYLKAHGLAVRQIDLNIGAYHYFLGKDRLLQSLAEIHRELVRLQRRANLSSDLLEKVYKFQILSLVGSYVVENIDKAKRDLRNSETFYDFRSYLSANYMIQKALEILSAEFYPTEISPYLLSMDASLEKIGEIEKTISNGKENPFIEFYEKGCLDEIMSENPSLVGISVTYSNQFIPALTLARLIKEILPSTHIAVGGGFITKLAEDIRRAPQFFDLVDSVIIYEGERPLLKLAEALEYGQSLPHVPNLVFRVDGHVQATAVEPALPISSLPTPLYDGLPLHLYLSPEPVLLIMESKGCYWNRCTFCDIPKNSTQMFQLKDVQRVVDDIDFYGETYGVRSFFFSTDSLVPKFINQFCNEVIRRGLNIYWQGELRFEKAFTDELLEKMALAGCRSLIFGFESGNQRVLDLMDKGTQLSNTLRILETCARLGIGVNLQSFVGFPTETREEAGDTVRFFLENRDILGSVSFGYFQLEKLTDVFEKSKAYGVEPVIDPKTDFHLSYPYRVRKGLSQDEILDLYGELKGVLEPSFYLDGESFATNGITPHSLLYFAHDYKKAMQHFRKCAARAQLRYAEKAAPSVSYDQVIFRESPFDMDGIATLIEEGKIAGSIKDLANSQMILVFNKETRQITQFPKTPLFWEVINRLNGQSSLSQIYRQICDAFEISAKDQTFSRDFREFIEFLYSEEIISWQKVEKTGRNPETIETRISCDIPALHARIASSGK